VVDVGGINIMIAVLRVKAGRLEVLDSVRYGSRSLGRFEEALQDSIDRFAARKLQPTRIAISAAGPVTGGVCSLTNLPWDIDSRTVRDTTGITPILINDFSAISYGIPLLSPDNPSQILAVPHTDGGTPVPEPGLTVVIGAGTGLGVGFLETRDGAVRVWPSEGGHLDFAPYDDETEELARYIRAGTGRHPDWEQVCAGPAIPRLFDFLLQTRRYDETDDTRRISETPTAERPRIIAESIHRCPVAQRTMELFVTLYGRIAGNIALQFLPPGGIYIAGGIAAKNLELFTTDTRFIQAFETTYLENLADRLRKTPVHIVRDYSISLYGAAYAVLLRERRTG
jgi:glucokinase